MGRQKAPGPVLFLAVMKSMDRELQRLLVSGKIVVVNLYFIFQVAAGFGVSEQDVTGLEGFDSRQSWNSQCGQSGHAFVRFEKILNFNGQVLLYGLAALADHLDKSLPSG